MIDNYYFRTFSNKKENDDFFFRKNIYDSEKKINKNYTLIPCDRKKKINNHRNDDDDNHLIWKHSFQK